MAKLLHMYGPRPIPKVCTLHLRWPQLACQFLEC